MMIDESQARVLSNVCVFFSPCSGGMFKLAGHVRVTNVSFCQLVFRDGAHPTNSASATRHWSVPTFASSLFLFYVELTGLVIVSHIVGVVHRLPRL